MDKNTALSLSEEYSKELLQICTLVKETKDFEIHGQKVSELFEKLANIVVAAKLFSEKEQWRTDKERALSSEINSNLQRILQIPGGEEWLRRCQSRAVFIMKENLPGS